MHLYRAIRRCNVRCGRSVEHSVTLGGRIWSFQAGVPHCLFVSFAAGPNTLRVPAPVSRGPQGRIWRFVLPELELPEPGWGCQTAVSKRKECIPAVQEAGVPAQRVHRPGLCQIAYKLLRPIIYALRG